MSERKDLFRAEAVEHKQRPEEGGGVVRIGPRWTTWAFWILIGLFLLGLVAATRVHVDRYARGATAADPDGHVVVLIPAALAPDVAPGRPVELGGKASAVVVSSGRRVLYPPEIKRRYGVDVAVPSLAVTTSAAAGPTLVAGTARVLVESDPLIVALVPGLKGLFGGGDG